MFSAFRKNRLTLLLVLLFIAVNFSLMAWECCNSCTCNRLYIGAFGGGLYSDRTRISQMGTALFSEYEGGPLAVEARGHLKSNQTGFGGLQIGYELSTRPDACSCWSLSPAIEIEAFWYSNKLKGKLFNARDRDRLPEHRFVDRFHVDTGVYLVNGVFSLNNTCCGGSFTPYIGLGVGAARISFDNAKSKHVNPPEPGINHFNSNKSDTSWAFVAQAKAGLRYNIYKSFHIFGEYRYLYVDFSNYIFGSTVFSTHARTTPWNVKVHNNHYNAFVFGLQYDL